MNFRISLKILTNKIKCNKINEMKKYFRVLLQRGKKAEKGERILAVE